MSEGETDKETLVEVRIAVACIAEKILSLEKINRAAEKRDEEIMLAIESLKAVQECRFRWVVILFLTLLMIFTGIVKVIPPL